MELFSKISSFSDFPILFTKFHEIKSTSANNQLNLESRITISIFIFFLLDYVPISLKREKPGSNKGLVY